MSENTKADRNFWLGILAFIVSTGISLGGMAVAYGKLSAKMDNLDGVRDRVIKLETHQEGSEAHLIINDARIQNLENLAGDELRWRLAPQK